MCMHVQGVDDAELTPGVAFVASIAGSALSTAPCIISNVHLQIDKIHRLVNTAGDRPSRQCITPALVPLLMTLSFLMPVRISI